MAMRVAGLPPWIVSELDAFCAEPCRTMKTRHILPSPSTLFFRVLCLVSVLALTAVTRAATWSEANVTNSEPLRSVRYLNKRWFAVGNKGTVLVSANGLNWNKVPIDSTTDFTDIAWGKDRYVLVSAGTVDTAHIPSSLPARYVSSDGLAWTPVVATTTIEHWASPFPDNSLSIDRILFARDRFVALAAPRMPNYAVGLPRTVLTSLDGESWAFSQSVGLNRSQAKPPIFDIFADTDLTLLAGRDLLASSSNGTAWTEDDYSTDPWHEPSPVWDQIGGYEHGYRVLGRIGKSFVALGFNMHAESADGVNWRKTILANGVIPLTYYRGTFYGESNDSSDLRLFSSVDGFAWTELGQGPAAKVESLVFGGGDAVAISGGRIFHAVAADLASSRPAKLLNISLRGRVGKGDDLLIGGFVIGGDRSPMQVLIRGVGPSLTRYGVTDPLLNPKLVLFDAKGVAFANNDNWGQAPDLSALREASTEVGAFPLIEGSNDAAMLVTLSPGIYTVHVISVDGSSGTALGEIYEVP